MQTLNVGAGRTDAEYKEAEDQRRADLRAESQTDANYFFVAAGLAAIASGLLPVRMNILVNIGAFDLLNHHYIREFGPAYPLVTYGAPAAWLATLFALGFAGRQGHRWAFLAGMALYAMDMIALVSTFSLWAFGVHAFFVFRWYQGQSALKDLNEPLASNG